AVVEALAAEPWSNGKIALVGTSYVGTTPIETAVLQPPHLATIVPMSAVTEWYRYYFENGEQRVNGDPPPGASYPDPALWMALGVAPGFRTGTVDPNDAACVAEYWREYWFQDDYDAFWKARDHGANAANITVPVLYAQGWRDENVATNMIPAWWDDVGAEKRAWFQQHGHGVPGSKEAFYEYQHRWLDHWLLDLENGVLEMPAVVVEDSRGKFRAEDAWPPADATGLRLFPAADGTLAAEPSDPGKASFVDDGSIATTIRPLRAAAAGTTYLAFEGEPLENAMHIAGEPVVHLRASSSAADTQWSVLLYELDEEGKTTFVTRGYLDARHRDSLEKGEDLAPGTEYDFHWRMHPRDHVVEAGHRLQLVVRSSDPYIIPDTTRATNTVVFGEEGSWLEIPAVPMDGRAYSDSAPDPWR
ncbi:MAG TPA: CocE/NonD family hydrolase, partial [Candidatus Thermoplasmatota archaeon]|nr:CocE/NonD family hydrolase [Candidatus Thermoplasmatota archaeon]